MACWFLREDLRALEARIEELRRLIREIGQEMGASCQEGAETFHDNFAFEDGERNQRMWGEQVRRLTHIRREARIVEPPEHGDRVGLGRTVTFRDLDSGEVQTFTIGSYMSFADRNGSIVSYIAPLARILVGAEEGDEREGLIRGQQRSFEILEVR